MTADFLFVAAALAAIGASVAYRAAAARETGITVMWAVERCVINIKSERIMQGKHYGSTFMINSGF